MKPSCCTQTPIATVRSWDSLAKPGLGGTIRGLVAHGRKGFVYERARADLGIPDSVDVMAMIVIGKRGPKENLPSNSRKEGTKRQKAIGGNSYGDSFTGK